MENLYLEKTMALILRAADLGTLVTVVDELYHCIAEWYIVMVVITARNKRKQREKYYRK